MQMVFIRPLRNNLSGAISVCGETTGDFSGQEMQLYFEGMNKGILMM